MTPRDTSKAQSPERSVAGVRAIAVFKLVKATALLLLGVATLGLFDSDPAGMVSAWARQLHLDPDGRIVHGAIERVAHLGPGRVRAAAAGMFGYAALLGVEGVGLLLGKRWAEYFTVVTTASLVPLEIYEITTHLTVTRVLILLVNLAIIGSLLARLRRHH